MSRRIRLLPVLIAAAAFMLSVRVAGLWRDLSVSIEPPPAQAKEDTGGAAAAPVPEEPAPPSAEDAQLGGDLVDLTDSELTVLQQLAARRQALEARARELDLREKVIDVAEQHLKDRIKELEAIREVVDAGLKAYDAKESAQMESLIKIYEAMKPKRAARIFEQLDMPILLDVVGGMREQKSAPVLAAMNPETARAVTAALALRRRLPAVPAAPAQVN